MAQALEANLVDFNEQLPTAMLEAAAEVYNLFNERSGGAIQIVDEDVMGNFPAMGYFANRDTAARRDITSSSARTPAGASMTTELGVVLSRSSNEDQTISALKKEGIDVAALSRNIANKFVNDKLKNAFASAVAALVGCLTKSSNTYLDKSALSSGNTISLNHCWDTLQLLGDMAGEVAVAVMHSYQATALKKTLGASANTAGDLIATGVIVDDVLSGHFMKPVIVTDNSNLLVAAGSSSGAYNTYRTLFLTGGAVMLKVMETLEAAAYIDRAYVNAMLGVTGEYEVELRAKGFSFSVGTKNPNDSTLATTGSWTQGATSVKHGPGALLITR